MNMNRNLEVILQSEKPVALKNLDKFSFQDIASELYDLYKQLTKCKNCVRSLLKYSGKRCEEDELEQIFQNNQLMIQTIMNRVEYLMNNPNIPPIDQQNKIDQYKHYLFINENKIKQCEQNQNRLLKLNEQLFQKINQKNEIQIQLLRQQLEDKNNQFQKLVFTQQLQSVNENSLKIDSDCQQFRERIDKINKDRDEIIRKMQDILRQFEQIQAKNLPRQNNGNQQINQDDYQHVINNIKETLKIMELMYQSLENFEKELELNLANENNQIKQQIKLLLDKSKKNRECFIYVRGILKKSLEMLEEIHHINQEQYKQNQELTKQLQSLQTQNIEFKNNIQDQINELKKSNESEQNIIANQSIAKSYKKENRLDLSNQYASLYNKYNQQIMQEINKLQYVILILFPKNIENQNIQANSELLQDITSFINSIKHRNQNEYNDSSEQQWQRSLELFNKIYLQSNTDLVVNKYIRQSLDCITEIRKSISNYKTQIEIKKQAIENQESQQRIN